MARNLEQMGVEAIIKNLPKYLGGMDKMGKSTQKTQGIIGKIGGIAKGAIGGLFKIGVAAGAAAIGGIALLSGALFKLASDAAPIASIKASFEELTVSMEGGSKAVLAALKEQSAGMITNTDLMKSFNLATLLIGESFTDELPAAMAIVGKVALATGEDMGFLMDSLVRGVGRLQPLIIDNLGVTVTLEEAYDNWAKANSRTVESMTKTEQQAALMTLSMELLAEKTKDMPEVAGTAQQAFGSFGVMMKNFKDELGLAVLPAVTDLMKTLSELAAKVLPKVVDFFKKRVVPILEKFGEIIKKLVAGEFKFENILPPFVQKIWEDFIGVIDKFRKWWERNGPFILMQAKRIFGTITDTISKLAESIIPWVVEQFDKIANWFDEHEDDITGAIKTIADFFEFTLGPAVITLWNNVLKPFLGDFIDGILDVAGALADVFGGGREEFFDVGLGVVSLGPRQKAEFLTSFEALEDSINDFLENKFPEHFRNFRDWVLNFFGLPNWQAVVDSWEGVWDLLTTIVDTWITDFKAKFTLENLFSNIFGEGRGVFGDFNKLLEDFGPGALGPPPQVFPDDPGHFEGQPVSPFFPGPTGNTDNSETSFNLTIHSNAPVEPIVQDFRMMRAMKGRV